MGERYLNYFKKQKVYGLNDTCYINRNYKRYKRFDDNIIPNHTNLIRHNKIRYVELVFGDLHDCSKIIRTLWDKSHRIPSLHYAIDEDIYADDISTLDIFKYKLLLLFYSKRRRIY